MSRNKWEAAMIRFMHRRDLEADLDQVWDYASDLFFNTWLRSDGRDLFPSDDALVNAAPTAMHHAGLVYLNELAQDDEAIQRETQLFKAAMDIFGMNYSIRNTSPVMRVPWYVTEMGGA